MRRSCKPTAFSRAGFAGTGYCAGHGDEMTDRNEGHGHKWGWSRRHGRGGPPWMRGGPFGGGFPFGPFGGKPGRMFGQGDLRLLLLALIADKPSHGYDLIRTIEARFGGSYAPSPGTIYPTLTLLEEQDLIAATDSSGAKKSYAATDKGRQYLADHADDVQALMAKIDIMAGGQTSGFPPDPVMQAIMTLRHAIMGKPGGWTAEEASRVRQILEEAARKIMGGGSA